MVKKLMICFSNGRTKLFSNYSVDQTQGNIVTGEENGRKYWIKNYDYAEEIEVKQ